MQPDVDQLWRRTSDRRLVEVVAIQEAQTGQVVHVVAVESQLQSAIPVGIFTRTYRLTSPSGS